MDKTLYVGPNHRSSAVATNIHVPPPHSAQRTHSGNSGNKPRNHIADLYTTWIAQLVERSYVKRETRCSTPGSGLYFSAIQPLFYRLLF